MEIRVLSMGDASFTIEFPNLKGVVGARSVRALRTKVQNMMMEGKLAGVVDLISATRSLTVCLDPQKANLINLRDRISKMAQEPIDTNVDTGQVWTLPVCYQGEYAPDLEDVAQKAGLGVDEVIKLHSSLVYDILLIGFLPGFPFMGEVPEILRFPRRTSPRLRVPAGSVAIANDQTAIYPWESPGGWHLLGRCPVPLFNPEWDQPSLLSAGGQVSFDVINEQDFETIKADLACGRLDPQTFLSKKASV